MNKKGQIGNLGGLFWKTLIIALIVIAFATGFIPVAIFSNLPSIVWIILIILFLFIAIGGRKK